MALSLRSLSLLTDLILKENSVASITIAPPPRYPSVIVLALSAGGPRFNPQSRTASYQRRYKNGTSSSLVWHSTLKKGNTGSFWRIKIGQKCNGWNLWDKNPSKAEVIGHCCGDEKSEWPRRTDKRRTLKYKNRNYHCNVLKQNIQVVFYCDVLFSFRHPISLPRTTDTNIGPSKCLNPVLLFRSICRVIFVDLESWCIRRIFKC